MNRISLSVAVVVITAATTFAITRTTVPRHLDVRSLTVASFTPKLVEPESIQLPPDLRSQAQEQSSAGKISNIDRAKVDGENHVSSRPQPNGTTDVASLVDNRKSNLRTSVTQPISGGSGQNEAAYQPLREVRLPCGAICYVSTDALSVCCHSCGGTFKIADAGSRSFSHNAELSHASRQTHFRSSPHAGPVAMEANEPRRRPGPLRRIAQRILPP